MSQATPNEDLPFHLRGNFAPVFDELTEFDLEVEGAIPPELAGRFFRNGANPKSGFSPHWFFGNGMLHGIELKGGKAVWYRNRYVRTPLLEDPDVPRMNEDGSFDRRRSCANTHVISHAGRILALEEGSFPFEVGRELETIGAHDFGGKLNTAMTAHPRICPKTGELLFFGYGSTPPYLTYHRVAADGTLVQSEEIDVKGPTMMHDWNVTRNHVIFMDLPMIFDLQAIASGGMPIRWSDDYGARLGVMPRDGGNDDVVWYEIDPCYVFHPMNSYEDGDKIVIDASRFAKLAFGPGDGQGTPPLLHRFTIDQAKGEVSEEPLDDRPADFPRVHDRVVGLKHRFGYMAGSQSGVETLGSALYKYDLETGKSWSHDIGDGHQAGEPVFAASPGKDAAEDEGWIMTFDYDAATDKSDLLIVDATNFDGAPVARTFASRSEFPSDSTEAGSRIRSDRVSSSEGHLSFGAQAFHYFQRDHESVPIAPIEGPAAWRGSELAASEEWIFHFDAAQVAELEAASDRVLERGESLESMRAESFPLPSLEGTIEGWRAEIEDGRGFLLLRGLPVERWGEERSSVAFWGLGLHLGRPGAQNPDGDLLGHVLDTGEEASNPNIRRYRTAGDIAYHCDLADVVCLLCLQTGRAGGASRIASSVAVFNEVLRRKPEWADRLFEAFLLDSRDEGKEDRLPYIPVPPCRYAHGRLRTFYHSDYFRSVVRHEGVPAFSESELGLLDLYEEIAGSEEFRLDMQFEPGDIQLVSNHSVIHARTAYEDDELGGQRRHLLRLWLSFP